MKFLLTAIFATSALTGTVANINNIENTNIVNVKDSKEDISKYKVSPECVTILKTEENIRNYVYLQLMGKYPEYSKFFQDLIVNRNNYIIAGDNFIHPIDPKGEKYNVLILASSTNLNFEGLFSMEITLLPAQERIDLSKFANDFSEYNFEKQATISIDKSNITASLELTEAESLEALDNYMLSLGAEEWTHSTSGNLFQDNQTDLTVEISKPYLTTGFTEAYFQVKITPKDSDIFLSYFLITYVHVTYNYQKISKSVSHSINYQISANWSTVKKYFWENNDVWYKALNIKDYLTDEEKAASNYDYLKAFASKYDYIQFQTRGSAVDYDNISYSLNKPKFTLQKLGINVEQIIKIASFKKNGFGVYSEVDHYITLRINSNYDLEYKVYCYMGVQGFGAKWQYTSLNSNIYNWEIK